MALINRPTAPTALETVVDAIAAFETMAEDHWPLTAIYSAHDLDAINAAWDIPRSRSILVRLAAAAGDTQLLQAKLNAITSEPPPVLQTATHAVAAALRHGKGDTALFLLRFFDGLLTDRERSHLAKVAFLNGMSSFAIDHVLDPWPNPEKAQILGRHLTTLDMEVMVARAHGQTFLDLIDFLDEHNAGPSSAEINASAILRRAIAIGDTRFLRRYLDLFEPSRDTIARNLDAAFASDNVTLVRWLRFQGGLERQHLAANDHLLVTKALQQGALECALALVSLLDWPQHRFDDFVRRQNLAEDILESLALRRYRHPQRLSNWPASIHGTFAGRSARDALTDWYLAASDVPPRRTLDQGPVSTLSASPGQALAVAHNPAAPRDHLPDLNTALHAAACKTSVPPRDGRTTTTAPRIHGHDSKGYYSQ